MRGVGVWLSVVGWGVIPCLLAGCRVLVCEVDGARMSSVSAARAPFQGSDLR